MEMTMLTMSDVDAVLENVYQLSSPDVKGFAVDGIDAVDLAELLFGEADIYGVGNNRIISAFWFNY
jgi:hypothetical protein